MTKKDKILNGISDGKTIDALSRDLGMRKQTVRAMIDQLTHDGILKELDCDTPCDSCPMGNTCLAPEGGREKLYVIAEEENEN